MATVPTYNSSGTLFENNHSTSLTVSMPSSRPADSLYLWFVACDDDDYTFDDVTGWTIIWRNELVDRFMGSASACIYQRIGEASEPATYVSGRSATDNEWTASQILRFDDVDTTTPIGAISPESGDNASSVTTATTLAITATDNDSLILRVVFIDSQACSASQTGEVARSTSTANGKANFGVYTEASPGASTTTGTRGITLTAAEDCSYCTLEIMPVAAGSIIQIMHQRRMQQ